MFIFSVQCWAENSWGLDENAGIEPPNWRPLFVGKWCEVFLTIPQVTRREWPIFREIWHFCGQNLFFRCRMKQFWRYWWYWMILAFFADWYQPFLGWDRFFCVFVVSGSVCCTNSCSGKAWENHWDVWDVWDGSSSGWSWEDRLNLKVDKEWRMDLRMEVRFVDAWMDLGFDGLSMRLWSINKWI